MLRGRVFPRRAPGPGARARVCTQAGVDPQAGPDPLLVPVLAERPLSRPTWRGVLLVWGNSGAASACPVHTSDLKARPQGLGCETSLLPERLRAAIIQDTGFLLRHPEEGTPASDRWPKWSPWPGHNAVELLTQKHRPGCGALGSAPRLVCLLSEFSAPGRHTHLRVTAFSYAPSTLPRNPGDPSPGHAPSSPGAGAGPFFLLPTLPSSSGLLRWALPTQPPSRPLATPHCMCDISILPLGRGAHRHADVALRAQEVTIGARVIVSGQQSLWLRGGARRPRAGLAAGCEAASERIWTQASSAPWHHPPLPGARGSSWSD